VSGRRNALRASRHLRARGLHSKHLDRSPGLLNHYLWTWLEDAGREYGVAIERVI
jgi:hypothetical protein